MGIAVPRMKKKHASVLACAPPSMSATPCCFRQPIAPVTIQSAAAGVGSNAQYSRPIGSTEHERCRGSEQCGEHRADHAEADVGRGPQSLRNGRRLASECQRHRDRDKAAEPQQDLLSW